MSLIAKVKGVKASMIGPVIPKITTDKMNERREKVVQELLINHYSHDQISYAVASELTTYKELVKPVRDRANHGFDRFSRKKDNYNEYVKKVVVSLNAVGEEKVNYYDYTAEGLYFRRGKEKFSAPFLYGFVGGALGNFFGSLLNYTPAHVIIASSLTIIGVTLGSIVSQTIKGDITEKLVTPLEEAARTADSFLQNLQVYPNMTNQAILPLVPQYISPVGLKKVTGHPSAQDI